MQLAVYNEITSREFVNKENAENVWNQVRGINRRMEKITCREVNYTFKFSCYLVTFVSLCF